MLYLLLLLLLLLLNIRYLEGQMLQVIQQQQKQNSQKSFLSFPATHACSISSLSQLSISLPAARPAKLSTYPLSQSQSQPHVHPPSSISPKTSSPFTQIRQCNKYQQVTDIQDPISWHEQDGQREDIGIVRYGMRWYTWQADKAASRKPSRNEMNRRWA